MSSLFEIVDEIEREPDKSGGPVVVRESGSAPAPIDDDLGGAYLERVTATRIVTEGDAIALGRLLSPPTRVYPCQRCSQNVSVIATGDPQRPARAVCDPCGLTPSICTCPRQLWERPA